MNREPTPGAGPTPPAPPTQSGTRRVPWTPILLISLCVVPLVAAWILLRLSESISLGDASHGQLIVPPRPLPDAALWDPLASLAQPMPHLHGRWSLVYLDTGACAASCAEQLYRMRQVRLAVGRHAARVQRVLYIDQSHPAPALRELLKAYPGQLLWRGSTPELTGAFRLRGDADPWSAGRLFLIDPRGNLMMNYAADADPQGIIKDLERLLRASRIG